MAQSQGDGALTTDFNNETPKVPRHLSGGCLQRRLPGCQPWGCRRATGLGHASPWEVGSCPPVSPSRGSPGPLSALEQEVLREGPGVSGRREKVYRAREQGPLARAAGPPQAQSGHVTEPQTPFSGPRPPSLPQGLGRSPAASPHSTSHCELRCGHRGAADPGGGCCAGH